MKYPNGQQKAFKRGKNRRMANKGMRSENLIERINMQYEMKGIAVIRKMPTPVKVLRTSGVKILEAVYEKGYLTDYMGAINDGTSVVFDMKECEQTSFSLENVKPHQYNILKAQHKMGAHAFLVVYMKKVDKYYRVPFEVLETAWKRRAAGGRKSIEQEIFDNECVHVKFNEQTTVLIDYLAGLY